MHQHNSSYDYESVIKDLSSNQINTSDAYIYYGHRLSHSFNEYFEFCQKNLLKESLPNTFDIEPSRFYFSDDSEVNATAFPRENSFFRITVNRGTVEELYDLFCENQILDDPDLKDYKNLDTFFRKSAYNTNLNYVIFDQCLSFIFFHELGHLVQFSKYEKLCGVQSKLHVIEEKNMVGGVPFDLTSHVMELDADKQAAHFLGHLIWSSWSKFPESEKNDDNLKQLIVVSLVGILSIFIMLIKFPETGLYYNEGDHPHPLIRLMWVSKILVDAVEYRRPGIESHNIMEETLRVLNIYSKHKKLGDIHEKYIDPYRRHTKDIGDYLYSLILTARNPGYEFLS